MKKMKVFALVMLQALLATALLAEKNILDLEFRELPGDYEMLPRREPEKWNFNFRPYNKAGASLLWTDPIMQRGVMEGDSAGDDEPTALYACCNAEGLTILVLAVENATDTNLAQGNPLPGSRLECFFAPGDADDRGVEHYYQFLCKATHPRIPGVYPWLMEDRTFRGIGDYIQVDSRPVDNGNMIKISIPWVPLFDRLPLESSKKDNFWRLSVIRWATGGGQTWGGVVHAASSAGYLRFPDFTQQQKNAIMENVLRYAWGEFHNFISGTRINPELVFERREPFYADIHGRFPRSYVNVNEDFGFRRAWLEEAIAERRTLGERIAMFSRMDKSEQTSFFEMACDRLFNFHYDLDQAYQQYLESGLFVE